VRDTFRQTDLMQRLQQLFPSDFAVTTSSAAAVRAFKEGRLISPLGVEGLHQIGNSAATLRQFYALGARYVTLNHNCPNKYSDAALWERPFRKAPPYWGGVSVAGRDMVHEMNRLGMLVDLSHTSDDTQIDVLGGGKRWTGSRAPVIFSHSSAYALCPHPRNVKDHVLQLVRKRDSLVMVNFAPDFVSCVESGNENGLPSYYPGNSTLEHVVDHIMHIGELIGYDHVGIGSDFDGINSTPRGLEDVSKFPKLIEELLRRGVSDQDAAKVAGGNILRVWKAAEDVAAEMQAANAPILEDDV
jgi:membrane dipeptidase